jgi:hypothetical protein
MLREGAKEGEGLRGYKQGGLVHIIKWERKEGAMGRVELPDNEANEADIGITKR